MLLPLTRYQCQSEREVVLPEPSGKGDRAPVEDIDKARVSAKIGVLLSEVLCNLLCGGERRDRGDKDAIEALELG